MLKRASQLFQFQKEKMMMVKLLMCLLLVLPLTMADSPCCSDAAVKTTPSAFETVKNWFDQGEDIVFEDIEGSFYLGRCYTSHDPDRPISAILRADNRVDESHGPPFYPKGEQNSECCIITIRTLLIYDSFTANQVQKTLEPHWNESKRGCDLLQGESLW